MQEFKRQTRNLKGMMRNLAFLSVLALCVSCSSNKGEIQDTVYRDGQPPASPLLANDPEMEAATKKAKETLPEFIAALEKELANPDQPSKLSFAVRHAFDAPHNAKEHMWVDVVGLQNGVLQGKLRSDPIYVKTLKVGDAVQVYPAGVDDWIILDDAGNCH